MGQLSKKYVGKEKGLYVAYIDLYVIVDWDVMWRMLDMYGINGNRLNEIKSWK